MNLLKPFLTIHEKFSYLICGFSQAFKKIKPMCYIDNIDTIRKTVSIHGLGMTSNFKFHFKDIINDYVILSNLSSLHSSWIGYYYGLYYVELLHSTDGSSQNITRFNFPSNDSKKRFKLLIQKRNGQISYLDRIKNQEYSADIIILLLPAPH